MIVVQLEDGTTIYGFGRFSVVARNASGALDSYWQSMAENHLAASGGDLRAALTDLPGARMIHEGHDGGPADPATDLGSRAGQPVRQGRRTRPR